MKNLDTKENALSTLLQQCTNLKTVAITTLGCDKNRCDSEQLAAILKNAGYTLVAEDNAAQIIIINTCAFIASARKEAIETIISKFKYKQQGTCEKIIVAGCLPVKHKEELKKLLPEVDEYWDIKQYTTASVHKLLSTPKSYAYIKIADGCNNHCSYCTIPSIRGAYRSRPAHEILEEIKHFAALGICEFILVAQDLTKYKDDSTNLTGLLRMISKIPTVQKIRLHYVYPNGITDDLISEIASNPKVCKYLDVPFQHASARILELMNRKSLPGAGVTPAGAEQYLALTRKLRAQIKDIKIRSTFMVGFPTETNEDFKILCDFLNEARLDYVGFFAFSREPGTRAYSLSQVSSKTKKLRLKEAQALQSAILIENHARLVGKTLKVVCDSYDSVLRCNVTRAEFQSPEVDPIIMVFGEHFPTGSYHTVKITGMQKENLIGEKTGE